MYFAALQDHPLGQFGVSVGGATYSPVTTRRALQELDYDPYHATRAGLRIPRRFAESLPTDISGCRRMTERQQAFVTILLPIVLRANEIVGLRDAVARARVGVDAPAVPSDLPPSLLIGLAAAVTDWGNDLTSSKASNLPTTRQVTQKKAKMKRMAQRRQKALKQKPRAKSMIQL